MRTSARGTSGSSLMKGSLGAAILHISPDMPGSRMRHAKAPGLGPLADGGRGGDALAATDAVACGRAGMPERGSRSRGQSRSPRHRWACSSEGA